MKKLIALGLGVAALPAHAAPIVFPSEWMLGFFVLGVVCGVVIIQGFRG